ncbi:MAG TPA: hypothetical protein VGI82_05760 [Chitinophagaceae bacterium]|jgi:hypothetical protein
MNTSTSLQEIKDIVVRPLAPVIQLKALPKEEKKPKRKISNVKPENNAPQIYNKPIYKSKKYDLL